MNYHAAFQHAVEHGGGEEEPVLILEPHVLLHRNFLPNLDKILEDSTWDGVRLIKQQTNTTLPPSGALIFRIKFLRAMLKTFLPFRESIDSEIYYQSILNKGKFLTCNPSLAFQPCS
jgi:hypothetical protein